MLNSNLSALFYLISSVLFILALKGLSSPESSRRGNMFGILGMLITNEDATIKKYTVKMPSNACLTYFLIYCVGNVVERWLLWCKSLLLLVRKFEASIFER